MGATNSENKNYSFFNLNGKADKDNTPAFWQVEKKDGVWTKTTGFDTITGQLVKASISEYQYEGQTKRSFKIELEDESGVCVISMSHNLCTYNIINCLLNVKKGQEIKIKVYRKHKKETNKYYAGSFLEDFKQEMIPWVFDYDAIPKPTPVLVDGKPFMKEGRPLFDDTKVQAFWESHFKTIMEELNTKEPLKDEGFPTSPPPDAPAIAEPDDLPF